MHEAASLENAKSKIGSWLVAVGCWLLVLVLAAGAGCWLLMLTVNDC